MPNTRAFALVLDSSEPEKLAEFYSRLLDAEVRVETDLTHLSVIGPSGPQLVIRRNESMVAPVWPQHGAAQEVRLRLIVSVDEVDAVEREVIGLGGHPLDLVDSEGARDTRTFVDPSGHPFALVAG